MTLKHPRLINNNFDLLRLLFAGIVCLVHAYELSGHEQLAWIKNVLSSTVAVKAFFIVSGFLIFMSYERSPSIISYAKKRARRVYPAYVTVILACAIGMVVIASTSASDYFSLSWLKYVVANLSFLNFLQPTLPGVFETNPLQAVNGALWTLKIEVMFYLSVPIFVWLFRQFGNLPILAIAYFGSIIYTASFAWLAESTGEKVYLEIGRQLPGQLSYFLAGAFFYYHLPFFERWAHHFLGASLILLAANTYWPIPFLEPFALAAVVIYFALFLYCGNFGKHGDFSYGIYILHFPIFQTLIHLGWFYDRPWLFLTTGVIGSFIGAIAMWHVVEKKFLRRNAHDISSHAASNKLRFFKPAAS